jgi:hypothetical protein
MAKKSKMDYAQRVAEAAQILHLANEAGCAVTLHGFGVSFKPPLPLPLLMRAMDVGDELANAVRAAEQIHAKTPT